MYFTYFKSLLLVVFKGDHFENLYSKDVKAVKKKKTHPHIHLVCFFVQWRRTSEPVLITLSPRFSLI